MHFCLNLHVCGNEQSTDISTNVVELQRRYLNYILKITHNL